MKVRNFWDDLTDVSAKIKSLPANGRRSMMLGLDMSKVWVKE